MELYIDLSEPEEEQEPTVALEGGAKRKRGAGAAAAGATSAPSPPAIISVSPTFHTAELPTRVLPKNALKDVIQELGVHGSGKDKGKGKESQPLPPSILNVLKVVGLVPGMLAVHRRGDHSKLLALAVQEQLRAAKGRKLYTVIVHAEGEDVAFALEARRLGLKEPSFLSYAQIVDESAVFQDVLSMLKENEESTLVVFEDVHTLFSMTPLAHVRALRLSAAAEFVLAMTPTPIVNHPSDLSLLHSLIVLKTYLPVEADAFDEAFPVDDETGMLEKRQLFESLWQNLVSVNLDMSRQEAEHLPVITQRTMTVPMSAEQHAIVQKLERSTTLDPKVPFSLLNTYTRILVEKQSPAVEDMDVLSPYLEATQHLCNGVEGAEEVSQPIPSRSLSPKLYAMADFVALNVKPAVVLTKHTPKWQVEAILKGEGMRPAASAKEYNAGTADVMVVADEEELASMRLLNTRQLHILEPSLEDVTPKVLKHLVFKDSHAVLEGSKQGIDVVQWICEKTSAQIGAERAAYGEDSGRPSADEFIMAVSSARRLKYEVFYECLECASIETNALKARPRAQTCASAPSMVPSAKRVELTEREILAAFDL